MDVSVFLLHTDDVWRVIGSILIYLDLVEREEAKLEEVLDDDSDLQRQRCIFFYLLQKVPGVNCGDRTSV